MKNVIKKLIAAIAIVAISQALYAGPKVNEGLYTCTVNVNGKIQSQDLNIKSKSEGLQFEGLNLSAPMSEDDLFECKNTRESASIDGFKVTAETQCTSDKIKISADIESREHGVKLNFSIKVKAKNENHLTMDVKVSGRANGESASQKVHMDCIKK